MRHPQNAGLIAQAHLDVRLGEDTRSRSGVHSAITHALPADLHAGLRPPYILFSCVLHGVWFWHPRTDGDLVPASVHRAHPLQPQVSVVLDQEGEGESTE